MRLAHHHARPVTCSIARNRQAGETLIEVLVAITLMGVGFAAVTGGIYTSVQIAETNQRYTKAAVSIQTLAEKALQPAKGSPAGSSDAVLSRNASIYRACATPWTPTDSGTYAANSIVLDSRAGEIPTGWTARITQIEYFNGWIQPLPGVRKAVWSTNASTCTSLTSYTNPAPGDWPRDRGMQRLTLEISNQNADRPVVDTLVIVKRDRRCPITFNNADLGPC